MKFDLRNTWVQIHLWLGLTLGVIGILIGLSGCVLVFDQEIDALLNPQRYAVSGSEVALKPADYLAKATDALAGRGRPANLRLPEEPGAPVMAIARSGGANGERPTILRVYLDPPTGKVLDIAANGGFVASAHDLHENLLLRQFNGRNVVGAVGIAMLISSLSGIYLWWPGRGRLRSGLTTRRGFPTSRNIHYLVGFYGSLMLGMLSFTGIYLAYPDFGRNSTAVVAALSPPARNIQAPEPAPRPDAKPADGVSTPDVAKGDGNDQDTGRHEGRKHAHGDAPTDKPAGDVAAKSADVAVPDAAKSDGAKLDEAKSGEAKADGTKGERHHSGGRRNREGGGNAPRIPVDDAIKIAQALYPDAHLFTIGLPTGARGVYRIGLNMPGTVLNAPGGGMAVFIDPASGSVLRRIDPAAGTAGDNYLVLMRSLHSAEGLGAGWKILYFLGGLLPAFLATTGTLMWLRGRRLRKNRPAPIIAPGAAPAP